VPDSAELTRKELDDTVGFAQERGAKGLAWARVTDEGWQSPIAKFLTDEEITAVNEKTGAKTGWTLFFVADDAGVVNTVLSELRLSMGRRFNLISDATFDFLWVTEFPLVEYSPEEKRYQAMHHPFTSPLDDDIPLLADDPLSARAKAYDLVLNGNEIGGGSVRISDPDVQQRVFATLGLEEEEAREKFGFLLDALSFGAPPHGGIAFGFDRIVMLMAGASSIREVIAFPKTQRATCLMTGAPTAVDAAQLRELNLKLSVVTKEK